MPVSHLHHFHPTADPLEQGLTLIEFGQIRATKVSCRSGRVPNQRLMMVHRNDILMLSGLEAHRYCTQIVDVFEESPVNLFLQPKHNRHGERQCKAAVPESIADRGKWLSVGRGGVQVDKVNLTSCAVDGFSDYRKQLALFEEFRHFRSASFQLGGAKILSRPLPL